MIRLRRNKLFPRQASDIGAFLFLTLMIPATFVYETSLVLPSLYAETAILFYLFETLATFVAVNVLGNFLCLWLVDTSTRFVVLPAEIKHRWNFCAVCESVTPPRSWHCNVCNICVLKREHHCMFVGYCVGHKNHRFFCLFLFYMWLGVSLCTYFNTYFVASHLGPITELTWGQMLKFVFPLVMLVTGLDLSWLQLYIFFWSVHFAALLLTSVLLIYHANLVLAGNTTFEANKHVTSYNLGWKQNLLEVFGGSWRLAAVWPFAASKLPHNGIDWDTRDTWKQEGPKHR